MMLKIDRERSAWPFIYGVRTHVTLWPLPLHVHLKETKK